MQLAIGAAGDINRVHPPLVLALRLDRDDLPLLRIRLCSCGLDVETGRLVGVRVEIFAMREHHHQAVVTERDISNAILQGQKLGA